jgi:CubicO group peptidase (beta-lactamase class C family)
MMNCPARSALLLCAALAGAAGDLAAQPAFRFADEEPRRERYETGGTVPLPPELQALLDHHASIIGLGLNTDWLLASGIDPKPLVEAIDYLADCTTTGAIPGAILYANRVGTPAFPISIGYLMTDPSRVMNSHTTLYELGELTGAVTAVPLALAAVERGDLRLDDTLGALLPEVAGAGKDTITVEMLLRHRSGLPRRLPQTPPDITRAEAIAYLNQVVPDAAPGSSMRISRYNHLLLGLILEQVYATPFQELAQKQVFDRFGMVNTTFSPPPAWRCVIAAGPYQGERRRMAWGEPTDSITAAFGTSAASGGLVSSADDLAAFAAHMLPTVEYADPLVTTATLVLAASPAPGGCAMGLGYMTGGLGKGSFGFDAAEGPSIWMMPDRYAYVVFLSNYWHPSEVPRLRRDPRIEVFGHIGEAILPLAPGATLTPADRTGP